MKCTRHRCHVAPVRTVAIADARVRRPRAVAIAIGRTIATALVALGADHAGEFRFHQCLREDPDALPQHVPILFFEELANNAGAGTLTAVVQRMEDRGADGRPLGNRRIRLSVFARTPIA
jgi:hypothetical protein